MTYLLLFYEFFQIGLFAVGGGLATIPFLYDLASKYPWFTSKDVVDMIAISESTPGAIGLNMATYVGYSTEGVLGSIVSTIAIILPAIIIVLLVSRVLSQFSTNKYVVSAFYGIRPTVTALISVACLEVLKVSIFNWEMFSQAFDWAALVNYKAAVLFALTLFLVFKFKKHPVYYIAGCALVGIFLF